MKCCRAENVLDFFYYDGQQIHTHTMDFIKPTQIVKLSDSSIQIYTDDFGILTAYPKDCYVMEDGKPKRYENDEFRKCFRGVHV